MQPRAPPMHVHHDTEQVFYVLEGEGRLEIEGESQGFVCDPAVVRIPPGTYHRVGHLPGPLGTQWSTPPGGRPTAEPTCNRTCGRCADQGWDFGTVKQARRKSEVNETWMTIFVPSDHGRRRPCGARGDPT